MIPFYFWLGHAASVWFMTGVIWLIQVVQYPLFLSVAPTDFPEFHRLHAKWITPVVGPVMLVELGSALGLTVNVPGTFDVSLPERLVLLGLTCVVFGATAFVSVPLHNRLAAQGWNSEVIRSLIRTNWIRTVAWTLHGGLVLVWSLRILMTE